MSPRATASLLPLVAALLVVTGCTRPTPHFSEPNARAHVNMLAATIGSRPIGSENNARARAYLVDQLELFGFTVRVQQADAVDEEGGLTARVSNIIAEKAGARPDAIALIAHYDSSHAAPGAADDALGTAVCLEAGRVLASRSRQHSLVIILTDGEEAGLLGARAAVRERDVIERMRAYLNFEAIGSGGPAMLFETGPGNQWLVDVWSRHASRPRGSSMGSEVYKRLPNDTDFSVFKTTGVPGLNFAAIGDSYAYHTARDVAERLSADMLQELGSNAVAVVEALDGRSLARGGAQPIFFDIMETRALVYGPGVEKALAFAAVGLGLLGWIRVVLVAIRARGVLRLVASLVGALLSVLLAAGVMVFAVWALRASREVYHPWYGHPWRMWWLVIACGIGGMWFVARTALVVRAARRRKRIDDRVDAGLPHEPAAAKAATIWAAALPVWIGLAGFTTIAAPAASFLFVVPLLAAGVVVILPVRSVTWWHAGALLVVGVSGTLWLPTTRAVFNFVVPMFGRLPMLTPVWAYPAMVALVGLMIGPPFRVLVSNLLPGRVGGRLVSAVVLAAIAILAGVAWSAPPYTEERPLRRYVRFVSDTRSGKAIWEVGSNEPGLDLGAGAPQNWHSGSAALPLSVPFRGLRLPFVFQSESASLPAPGDVGATLERVGDELRLDVTARLNDPAGRVVFVVPGASAPLRSNLAGTLAFLRGAWTATYVAPPPEGVSWRAAFAASDEARVRNAAVVFGTAGLPGGSGWQRLPKWLPQERAVWNGFGYWIEPIKVP